VHQFKHTGVKPTAIYTAFMHVYITPEFWDSFSSCATKALLLLVFKKNAWWQFGNWVSFSNTRMPAL
jgi:hypothetical protein